MNRRTFSAILVLLTFVCASAMAACGRTEKAATPRTIEYNIIGAGIYSRLCSGCHGERGEGRTALGPPLDSAEFAAKYTDDQIREIIEKGREAPGTRMEPFADKISADEMKALIEYVHQLKK